MFNPYIKSAIRNLWNYKANSVINIAGMSIGLACCIVISLYVFQEFSFDRFHNNADQIFRVCYQATGSNVTLKSCLNPLELSEQLKNEVPQIEKITAYKYAWYPTLKYNNQYFQEKLAFVQPDFFDIFSFKLLHGNPGLLLNNPNDIVITEDFAAKLTKGGARNYEDLLGKSIEFPNNVQDQLFTITGIFEKVPEASSMEFSVLVSINSRYQNNFSQSNNDFGNTSIYLKLKKGTDVAQLTKAASPAVLSFYEGKIEQLQNDNILPNTADCFIPIFQPLTEVYLDSSYDNDYTRRGNKKGLYILSGIGILILLVGCFNFILLSLGQAFGKIKRIEIQKVFGARNINILRYFIAEVNINVFLALFLGILISIELLPLFNKFAQTDINTNLFFNPVFILFMVLVYLFIIVINSIIPFLIILKGNPVLRLKGINTQGKQSKLPFVFVTLQYGLSIILIISSLLINHQVRYMKNKNPGFISMNILCIELQDMLWNQRLVFRDRLKTHPGIINAATTDRDFTGGRSSNTMKKENGENVVVRFIRADENFIQTLGLELVAGESFTAGNINEYDNNLIVNEKFLSSMEITNDPFGKTIKSPDLPFDVNILGVVKDFNYDSMKENLQPLALVANTRFESMNYLLVRFNEKSTGEVLTFIKSEWEKSVPDREAQISFWDEKLESRYQDEDRWSQIISFASIISVFITSLGLLGLTLLIISKRTKEIGIRKINGARAPEILVMLNLNFIRWVAVALLISSPAAWLIMHKWLDNFAYKTNLSWWIFALAGSIALIIAIVTVSLQSWWAATRNPIEALRYE
jgi:putative ABC transport system permease protein